MARLHVIGGGLAGLAAAVRAAQSGAAVTVYEAAGQAGGRCRSFYDRQLGCIIDNGNHLLLSGNRSARAYLRAIGAADRLIGPGEPRFDFVDLETSQRWQLRPNAGPFPGWIFRASRRVPGTRARDYLSALALIAAPQARRIGAILDPDSTLYRRFWEPLIVAALNTAPEDAAAGLLQPVLKETLLRGGAYARPLIARESLADTLIEPAMATLRACGAELRFHSRVTALETAGDRVTALQLGEERIALAPGERAVLAVPARIAGQLLGGAIGPPAGEAIVNVHFRLPVPAGTGPPILGLIGGLAQWVFLRGEIASVTISAGDATARRPAREIAARCWRDVARALKLEESAVPAYRVVKEKRATFAAIPEALTRRPGPQTAYANLALAGDWTATGLPATIESAVRSGHEAVKTLGAA